MLDNLALYQVMLLVAAWVALAAAVSKLIAFVLLLRDGESWLRIMSVLDSIYLMIMFTAQALGYGPPPGPRGVSYILPAVVTALALIGAHGCVEIKRKR